MKLADLYPRFLGAGGEGITRNGQPVPRREGVGVMFDCPCGASGCTCFIPFENPLDGGPPYIDGHPTWHREGDTFETMTLSPSIQRLDPGGCRWHGYVRDGFIVPA